MFIQADQGLPRATTAPVELAGVSIPAGATVHVSMAAASRDPAVFPDPHTLRLDRERNPHLGFGHGPHHCLGAHLARVEIQEALRALITRLAGLRPAVAEEELRPIQGSTVRGFETLPLMWGD